MLVVRAIKPDDLDPLLEMAAQVGSGMTTLKPDRKLLGDRVDTACASFAETIPPEQRDYLFVLEDTSRGCMAGVCAIKGAVGLTEPFYNYRIGTLVHSSRELNILTRMETLYLSNDLTGHSELCSLFLHPDYRKGNNGKLLSKSRFLFIAQFPHLFTDKIIAEMRGYQYPQGGSPFYEALGRHFFKMEFDDCDELTAKGQKSFIAELMPRQPEARDAVGRVHDNTAPARRLLEQEGMYFDGYVDIFDAGPVLRARVRELRAMRESALSVIDGNPGVATVGGDPYLVSNTVLRDFRMILANVTPDHGRIALSEDDQKLLQCQAGDAVRTLSLNLKRTNHE